MRDVAGREGERGARGSARSEAPEWPRVPLGELCEIAIGKTPSRSQPRYWGGDLPWAAISDLTGEVLSVTAERITREGADECRCRVVPSGTLLFSFKLTIGKMCFAGCDLYTNEAIAALTPLDPAVLSKHYLRYALAAIDCEEGSSHAVKGKTLNQDGLHALSIPLPPLAEQGRIAGRLKEQLGAAERARAAAAQRLAAAEALPAALRRQVFGERPPFDAAPLSPTAPTQPGWKWHRLTSIARLATGHTPSRRCLEYWNGDIPWIQLPDIRALDGRVAMDTSEHVNALGIENSAAVRLPAGTVCLSRTASVGFVTIMGRAMATSQDFVNWVCGPELDPAFLMHLLIACRKPIRDLGSGATHHTIYFPTVEQFSVCVPGVDSQREIVAALSAQLGAAEGVIARCRQELAGIEALPAALLRAAFNGAP